MKFLSLLVAALPLAGIPAIGSAPAGSYIVAVKDSRSATALTTQYGGSVVRTYQHALTGFEWRGSAAAARRMAADPAVRYVEPDHEVRVAGVQTPTPSWGLDRVDQRGVAGDKTYTYPNTGAGVTAYIIDTGIRLSHQDFGGRAVSGVDKVDNDSDASDCNGHGTFVSGVVGGTTHGVAKQAKLVGVRVLNCYGSGRWVTVIAAIDWMIADHRPGQPAVANMSLSSGKVQSANDAVAAAVADGIVMVVAAGNDNGADACTRSPASTPAAISVGATDRTDKRSGFSNVGPCLDLFAPGSAIVSDWHTADDARTGGSGTSYASPHVAGAAALVLNASPSSSPQQVRDALVAEATTGALTSIGVGSPNRLLYISPKLH
ncbi:subtilisin family serine protease [Actinokineospora baliensis]|uniref:S8 family peptidase n=1 Tax=Actinokineospora baliensis TaxID=547056 RepID=UPI0019565C56|nr:S8 family peptidase [Actinokineospora baliensis]MBM7775699.1 subtilisin family serine protease [Actinokineospora baliensis]